MHMIRNCVSHGIEKGDERIRRGKRKEGVISLSARREGINIIIEIRDDGAGIDTKRVFNAAVNQGLIKPEKKLSDVFYINGNGHADKKDNFVIVCSISNKKIGLIVDNVLIQEEAIIKPVNRFLEGLSIYSGITISGEGKVRLVLNPLKVFEGETRTFMIAPPEVESLEGRRVLIVDDSLSVRKY